MTFAYDPYFPRRTSMTDGSGNTTYAYVPVGSLGALQVQQETTPLAAIAYGYDALGRLASRTVGGQGAESFGYDAIGRLTGHAGDLGSFTLGYLGQTGQMEEALKQAGFGNIPVGNIFPGDEYNALSVTLARSRLDPTVR